MSVLTTSAGLLRILVFLINRLGKGFLVSNLRSTYVCFYVELTKQTVNDDLKVKLTHTCDNGLAGFLVGVCLEGRVLFRQLLQRIGKLILTSLGLGLDCELDNGIRELHGLQNNRSGLIAKGITGCRNLQTYCCSDIAGEYLFQLRSLVRMHLKNTADTLLLILGGVQNVRTGLAGSGINTHECELSDEGIGDNLECQCREGLGIRGMSLNFVSVQIGSLDCRDIKRRRHILNHCIQALLNALILICGSAADRNSLAGAGCLAKDLSQSVNRRLLALKVLLHQIIIQRADLLYHLVVVHLCLVLQVIRNRCNLDVGSDIVLIIVSFHIEQIDQSDVSVFLTDRNVDHNRVLAQSVLDLVYAAVIVCADDIHLVDKCHAGNVIGISLTPYVLRLRLNAALCGEYTDSAVQNTKGTFNLYGEVYVSGGINDIDAVLESAGLRLVVILFRPMAGCCRGRNGNTTLLLLGHIVHGCSTIVCITDLVVNTGIEQDTLGQSRLTCIDMSHDTDVPGSIQGILSFFCHRFFLLANPASFFRKASCLSSGISHAGINAQQNSL